MVDQAANEGLKIVIVPENVKLKLRGLIDVKGSPVRDLAEFMDEWNNSFEFSFVPEDALTESEKAVYSKTDSILQLVGGKPSNVKVILISETMRVDVGRYQEALGVWEETSRRVIIKRSELRSLEDYAAVLLHEIAHAISGASDVSREFEHQLTILLGKVASNVLLGGI